MPVKHIDEETWLKVEKKTIKEIISTGKSIKEGQMLKRLILIGLKHYDDEQFTDPKKKVSEKEKEIHH